jgi:hypothetical protein
LKTKLTKGQQLVTAVHYCVIIIVTGVAGEANKKQANKSVVINGIYSFYE